MSVDGTLSFQANSHGLMLKRAGAVGSQRPPLHSLKQVRMTQNLVCAEGFVCVHHVRWLGLV